MAHQEDWHQLSVIQRRGKKNLAVGAFDGIQYHRLPSSGFNAASWRNSGEGLVGVPSSNDASPQVDPSPEPPGQTAFRDDLTAEQLALEAARRDPRPGETRLRALAVGFFISALVLFAVCMGWLLFVGDQLSAISAAARDSTRVFVLYTMTPLILLFAALCCCGMGYLLINAAGTETRRVLPRPDSILLSRLIEEEKEAGINLYVRLSSLTGVTGVFTKIGFSGLPLATMGLTIFLTLLSLHDDKFVQMAQLSLGAFIGSFVERRQSAAGLPNQARPGQ
jgi:hypothetical protein